MTKPESQKTGMETTKPVRPSNMHEVVLWTADGTWIGAVTDEDIFGTSYPWFAAADMADDGSILVVMSDTRADESADEVLVFKLSGF